MKLIRNLRTRKIKRIKNRVQSATYNVCLFLLPGIIVACGGSLGNIQPENINAVIAESETAIEQARLVNARSLAPDPLHQAEKSLADAKKAVEAKEGLRAMQLAYDARIQARIAEQEAMYKSQEEGLNAIIKRKEAQIGELQADTRTVEIELEKSRAELQRLDLQRSQLQAEMDRKLRDIELDRQSALRDYSTIETEVEQLRSKLDTTHNQYLQAQQAAEARERQIYQLRRELALAQSMVAEARSEAKEAQTKAATQARNYSSQIEQLDQSTILKQKEDLLARKKQEAYAYVQRQAKWTSTRTGQTSLTSQQIEKGKGVISDWYLAWATKDTNQHVSDYVPELTVERVITRSGTDEHTTLNRTQMVDAVQRMIDAQWIKTDAKVEADGESVIGTYRFSRLSQNSGNGNQPALYDVWTREVWVTQIGSQWKISREIWRIYEDVPKYATIFN